MDDLEMVEVPARLYAQARRRLLENEPLRDQATPAHTAATAVSAGEAAALESVGLPTSGWTGDSFRDPLMYSITDYMALLETSFTIGDVAELLKVDVSRIRQRLRERSLYGVDYDGERRLPRFQFEREHVMPGIREVLAALPEGLNPIDVAQWFLAPNPDLDLGGEATSPRMWLFRGEAIDAVVLLARGFE